MCKSSIVFSAILLLVFVLAISEIARVNGGELCERKSKTFSSLICRNRRCDRRCIAWEKALHGACHFRDWGLSCYCYYDTCAEAPPPPPPPSPGGSGGSSGKGDVGGKGAGGGR
ncbi:putative knottin, scorpion toxin [Helianthus annuus]|uniref:Knottin, scorpion toxin n=1 Tax=Helianthus annuus TaxID=4232 RepID=A0A251RYP2_HELAN|nr:putative knottin, scorpion toxin [Helianthus annuus]KAJ0441330.1 putative knottin, scorpion toxin [Helianthus annuus]KAJ0819978.1 putative knottin, scorpion toxin [Helianthus annuus]